MPERGKKRSIATKPSNASCLKRTAGPKEDETFPIQAEPERVKASYLEHIKRNLGRIARTESYPELVTAKERKLQAWQKPLHCAPSWALQPRPCQRSHTT